MKRILSAVLGLLLAGVVTFLGVKAVIDARPAYTIFIWAGKCVYCAFGNLCAWLYV